MGTRAERALQEGQAAAHTALPLRPYDPPDLGVGDVSAEKDVV